MLKALPAAVSTALLLGVMASQATESTLQLQLSTQADFERLTVQYDCGGETPLVVTYLNAAPNFLALVTPPEQSDALVFAAVSSGSGARYAAAHWIWWNDGQEASLYDAALGEDADPILTCSEFINTP